MAYAHYWRRALELDEGQFLEVVADIKQILERVAELDIKLAGPTGSGAPEVSRYTIAFNGLANCGHRFLDLGKPFPRDTATGVFAKEPPYDRTAEPWFSGPYLLTRACGGNCSGEAFIVDRKYLKRDWELPEAGGFYSSCDTGFKPYDLIVTLVLMRLKERLPDQIRISSDGEEWAFQDAKVLCREMFGWPKNFAIDSPESSIV